MKLLKSVIAMLTLAVVGASQIYAADTDDHPTVDVSLDARADFEYVKTEGVDDASSGIHGRYFNLKVNGTINSQLSYSWRQRLNKYKDTENDVFSATDWIYLKYKANDNFAFSAGKEVVMIGGYEYDAAPIDVLFACRFWNNFACYQFGASAYYTTDNGNHTILAQVTNSPYAAIGKSMYSYNLFWSGKMGSFNTLWSVNMIEYAKDHYANFISLGNRFDLGAFNLELDLMNRATSHHKYLFGDYSIIAKAEYAATPWLTLMAKGGYEDWRPIPGANEHYEKPFYGGALIFYPLKSGTKRNLRIHALGYCYHDNSGVRNTELNVGLTWYMPIYSRH